MDIIPLHSDIYWQSILLAEIVDKCSLNVELLCSALFFNAIFFCVDLDTVSRICLIKCLRITMASLSEMGLFDDPMDVAVLETHQASDDDLPSEEDDDDIDDDDENELNTTDVGHVR